MAILTTVTPPTNEQRLADWNIRRMGYLIRKSGATLNDLSLAFETAGRAGIEFAQAVLEYQALIPAIRPRTRINLAIHRRRVGRRYRMKLYPVLHVLRDMFGWILILAVIYLEYLS